MTPILIVAAVFAVVVLVGVVGFLQARRRRQAFEALAGQLGLTYRKRDPAIAQRYHFLDKLRQGHKRYAFNILDGAYQDYPVSVFDYHYETYSRDSKGHRQTHHHYFSFFVLEQDREFPELRIYPEGLLSKLGQMMGFDDIDFESVEFSKAFVVRSKDKKFAYDVCHTGMMTYLLDHRDLSIEIEGRAVSLSFDRRLKPEQIEPRLRQLLEIRNLFPEYLYRG